MPQSIQKLIESRVSTNFFDTTRSISDEVITSLLEQAIRAPSAYNFQNWRFIAVRSPAAKERLKSVAYGQQKIVDASATFIVCGTLNAHKQLADILKPSVDAGIVPAQMAAGWVTQASGAHEGNATLQRDEAIRSGSLAGMTLMLAAQGMGLATGPMVGFDPQALAKEFALRADDVPVMLITVGYPAEGNWPQKPRRALAEVAEIV